jgi:hypothetical protein
MPDDKNILKAVKRLADERPHLLGDDAEQITQWLKQTSEQDHKIIRKDKQDSA